MNDSHHDRNLEELLRAVAATGYIFVPPTPETHRRVNARAGNETARNLRDVFGWSRPFGLDAVDAEIRSLMGKAEVLEAAGALFKSTVRVATLNGRSYLHSAFPTLEADAVFFGPDTYRFVRAALAVLPNRAYARAIDLACGSGAGGLAIAAERPIGELWLTDINPKALAVARVNAAVAGKSAQFAQSDLFQAVPGDFDLIVSNPPYLADGKKRAYRDGGGALGLDLGLRIVREGLPRLSEDGVLFLYTGVPIIDGLDPFRSAIEQIVPPGRFHIDYSEIDPDVFGEELDTDAYRTTERIAVIALTIHRLRT
jgi:methylase of polypeptide subunit release factors